MYKIYKIHITRFGMPVIFIVTAFQNPGGFYKAESFSIFPKPKSHQIFNSLTFNKKSFDDSSIILDEKFMLEEALAQAQIDLTSHIELNYADIEHMLLPQSEWNLQEVDIVFLAHLQVRQSAEFLVDIYKKTECEELQNSANFIIKLPKISKHLI